MTSGAKPRHGGKRPGAGRPPSASGPSRNVTVRLPAGVKAELTAALRPGESLAALLRDGGLRLARERADMNETLRHIEAGRARVRVDLAHLEDLRNPPPSDHARRIAALERRERGEK